MNDCCRYDFEQNKKNNLIFHGIIADHPETPEGWVLTAEMEISYQNLKSNIDDIMKKRKPF